MNTWQPWQVNSKKVNDKQKETKENKKELAKDRI